MPSNSAAGKIELRIPRVEAPDFSPGARVEDPRLNAHKD